MMSIRVVEGVLIGHVGRNIFYFVEKLGGAWEMVTVKSGSFAYLLTNGIAS